MYEYRQPKPYFINISAPKGQQDFSRYVTYLHTHKSLDQSAGTWEIQLSPVPFAEFNVDPLSVTTDNIDSDLYRLFRPMDAVLVGMNESTIMLGFVDNLYKTLQRRGDSVSRKISIRGRDGMKIFHEDSVANAPELATQASVKKLLGSATTQFLGWIRGLMSDNKSNVFANSTVPEAVWWILQNTPSMNVKLDGGLNNKTVADFFLTSIVAYANDKLFDEQLSVYSGKIINYIVQILDSAFYEIWIDTIPKERITGSSTDKPCLFIRPRPFDFKDDKNVDGTAPDFSGKTIDNEAAYVATENSSPEYWLKNPAPTKEAKITSWEDLTCPVYGIPAVIKESEIISKNLGVSDFDVFTMYKCTAAKDPLAVSELGKYGLYFPLIDGKMVKSFGVREMQAESKMLPPMATWYSEFKSETAVSEIVYTSIAENAAWMVNLAARMMAKKQVQNSIIQKRDRLWRWNRNNNMLESGTISIVGRDIRVGCKVILSEEQTRGLIGETGARSQQETGMEFYCISVDNAWNYGGNYITSLGVTRGHNKDELRAYRDLMRHFDKPMDTEASGIFTAKYT